MRTCSENFKQIRPKYCNFIFVFKQLIQQIYPVSYEDENGNLEPRFMKHNAVIAHCNNGYTLSRY